MDVKARTSRRRLLGMLSAVAAVHAGVILTSEREGPGSAQLRVSADVPPTAVPNAAAPRADAATVTAPAAPTATSPVAGQAGQPVGSSPAAPNPSATSAPVPASPTSAAAEPTVAPPPASPTAAASPTAPANPNAPAPAVAPASPTAATASTTAPRPLTAAAADASYPADPPATVAAPTPRPAAPTAPKVALSPTQTMPGGRNNYVPNAPLVPDLGKGFVVSGTVLDTATGEPVRRARVQIWLNTARGGERESSNRGSVVTDELGKYRLETSPVVPVFGQPHVHIGYDDGRYSTLFLRPVLKSEKDSSIAVDFVLGPPGAA